MCVSFSDFGSQTARWRPARVQGEQLRGRMTRPFLAESWVVGHANSGGEPHAAALVEHRVVHVVAAGPDHFRAPVRRRRRHLRRRARRFRIANRQRNLALGVPHGIEHRHVVRTQLECAVDRTIGVDRRIAAIGGDHVMQVDGGIRPIPHRDDDVALDTLRTRRGDLRNRAGRNPVGPLGKHLERALAAHAVEPVDHVAARLTGLNAAIPRVHGAGKRPQLLRDFAGGLVAKLMTRPAAT